MSKIDPSGPIVFFRIAWMKKYQGITDTDVPQGAGSFVALNKRGYEVYNFLEHNSRYHGFARIHGGGKLNLTKLGAAKEATELPGVTAVFFATEPKNRSQYIVGWYKNATILKVVKDLKLKTGQWQYYLASCKASDGILLPEEARTHEIIGPGRTNVWYPRNHLTAKQLNNIVSYLNDPSPIAVSKEPKRRGWVKDAELRKRIEVAAMDAISEYYIRKGFRIDPVFKENKGWDIEATNGKVILHLEVKGTQGDFNTVDVTPNEYKNISKNSKHYRVCIVSFALEKRKQKTDIFYYENGDWVNSENEKLKITEMISGRLSLKS